MDKNEKYFEDNFPVSHESVEDTTFYMDDLMNSKLSCDKKYKIIRRIAELRTNQCTLTQNTVSGDKLIEYALECGFTDSSYGLLSVLGESDFNGKIGVEEYAIGDRLTELLGKLGIGVIK